MATDAPITPAVSPATSQHVTVAEVMRPATTSVESRAHLAAAAYLMKRSGDSALVVLSDDMAAACGALLERVQNGSS